MNCSNFKKNIIYIIKKNEKTSTFKLEKNLMNKKEKLISLIFPKIGVSGHLN